MEQQASADLGPSAFERAGLHRQGRMSDVTLREIGKRGYTVVNLLGSGATADVYLARENGNRQRKVAIKVIADPRNQRAMKQFHRERRVLCSDRLPASVVHYYGAIRERHFQPVLVLEALAAEKIDDYVKTHPLGLDAQLALIAALFRAVKAFHDCGLLFGDLSFNNVLVECEAAAPASAWAGRIRFIDFGQSRRQSQAYRSAHSLSGPVGTPGFATQKALGGVRPEVADDIRACAAIAYHVLTSKVPAPDAVAQWQAELVRAQVPAGVRDIVVKALREPARDRNATLPLHDSAESVAKALDAWRANRARRRTMLSALLATLALAALAMFGWDRYRDLRTRALQERRTVLLQELQRLPQADEPAVAGHEARAMELWQQYQRLSADDPAQAAARLEQSLDALRTAIRVANGIAGLRPRLRATGEILNATAWASTSPTIRERVDAARSRHLELSGQVEAGQIDALLTALPGFESELSALTGDNVRAARAEDERRAYEFLEGGIAPRLRELAAFGAIASRVKDARDWRDQGEHDKAQAAFGRARQALEQFLGKHETEGERHARQLADEQRVEKLRNDKATLDSEVERLRAELFQAQQGLAATTEREQQQASRVTELEQQIQAHVALAGEVERLRAELLQAQQGLAATTEREQQQAARVTELEQQIQAHVALAGEVERLRAELNTARDALTAGTELAKQRTGRIEELEQEVAAAGRRLTAAQTERDSARQQLAAAQAALEQRPNAPAASPSATPTLTGDYEALARRSHAGLELLGKNPRTGFYEYWHTASGSRPVKDTRDEWSVTGDTGLVLVLLPGGTFRMGSDDGDGDEKPVHEVTLAPFFLSKYEMTQGQWKRLSGQGDIGANPVVEVSWDDCRQHLGRWKLRLPTESQWEYGARGGTTGKWWCAESALSRSGNLEGTTDGTAGLAPVGRFAANPYGLFDVIGNVWEWCEDGYAGDAYAKIRARAGDGLREVPAPGNRVSRGGSFGHPAVFARSAYRNNWAPGDRLSYLGFRPARIATE